MPATTTHDGAVVARHDSCSVSALVGWFQNRRAPRSARPFQSDLGYTVIELLMVAFIIVVIAVIGIPFSANLFANFRLGGLDRTFEYIVRSDREGELGIWTGAKLMDDGVDLYTAESTRAHLLTFTKPTAEESRRRKQTQTPGLTLE